MNLGVEHQYSWLVDDRNVMTIWEDNRILATIEDCAKNSGELFMDVVFELRGIDLSASDSHDGRKE